MRPILVPVIFTHIHIRIRIVTILITRAHTTGVTLGHFGVWLSDPGLKKRIFTNFFQVFGNFFQVFGKFFQVFGNFFQVYAIFFKFEVVPNVFK